MKNTKISELPLKPEDVGIDYTPSFVDTDMTKAERLFVSGLIKYYEPRNILEVGVAGGGGSANILNTIQDMHTTLVSIDVVEKFNHPYVGVLDVGTYAIQDFPTVSSPKWRLLLGKDPSERMDELNEIFDLLILDTNHVHPSESLNFLSVLPYLSDNAVIILHDITLYMNILEMGKGLSCFATRILMSAVCADKLEPNIVGFGGHTNIVAFQMSPITRQYIRNVFDALMLPWEWFPNTIDVVRQFINKHYSEELRDIFERSVQLNLEIALLKGKLPANIKNKMSNTSFIFYGAGNGMKNVLSILEKSGIEFNFPIFDVNAEHIKNINGHPVTVPDFTAIAKPGQTIIITIENEQIANEVRTQFEALGYMVFHRFKNYILSH